jgi:hypothetical protein
MQSVAAVGFYSVYGGFRSGNLNLTYSTDGSTFLPLASTLLYSNLIGGIPSCGVVQLIFPTPIIARYVNLFNFVGVVGHPPRSSSIHLYTYSEPPRPSISR